MEENKKYTEICTISALINGKEYILKVKANEAIEIMKMIRKIFEDECERIYVTEYDPFSKETNMSLENILSIINKKDNAENKVK